MSRAIEIHRNLIVDTGFWYALFNPRDQWAQDAQAKANYLDTLRIVFPWPTLYETIGTRFVKNKDGMARLERLLKNPRVELIDDRPYREQALDATLREARSGGRSISLCDMLIRLLIEDTNLRISALLTFNVKDFHDVCRTKGVEIL